MQRAVVAHHVNTVCSYGLHDALSVGYCGDDGSGRGVIHAMGAINIGNDVAVR